MSGFFMPDVKAGCVAQLSRRALSAHHKGLTEQAGRLGLEGFMVDYRAIQMDSYFSSVISDFIRQRLLTKEVSFKFETVMSHPRKVEFMRET
ncbi:hypothetical protein MJP36_20230 [Pseudomonas palleroniana]|uniref:hypothetical protein n=1 Tax=Pseudomonas palleroniana TaxID=191390 RepID=UPI001FCBC234|nr:hypothetical protein [Pseudomonas palleroniana]UOK36825.1 hypothetical protein MJP36_20230 [Pseudomonas palleroniana]